MGQIKKLIELIKRLFKRNKKIEDEEPIILNLELPNLDKSFNYELVGEKSEFKPLNYPLECTINIKIDKISVFNNRCRPLKRWINIKKARWLKNGCNK